MPTELVAVIVGSFALLMVVVGVVAFHFVDRILTAAEKHSVSAQETSRLVAEAAIIFQTGLNPHVVNPERFGPTGMSRQDEKLQAPPVQGEPVAEKKPLRPDETEGEAILREAEEKFFELMAKAESSGEPPGRHRPT